MNGFCRYDFTITQESFKDEIEVILNRFCRYDFTITHENFKEAIGAILNSFCRYDFTITQENFKEEIEAILDTFCRYAFYLSKQVTSSFGGCTRIAALAFLQCTFMTTHTIATSPISSHWTRADASISVMKAERVSQRSTLSCARACLPPQCPRFAFRRRDGSCLLGNPMTGAPTSVGGYFLYDYGN